MGTNLWPEFVGAGECVTRRGWRHQPERLDWHKLIFARRGLFSVRAGEQNFDLKSDCFLVVPAGTTWRGTNKNRESDCFRWIMFRGEAMSSPRFGCCRQSTLLDALFDALLQRLPDNDFSTDQRRLLTATILNELEYQARPCPTLEVKVSWREHDIAHQAILEMKDALDTPFDLMALAVRLHLNSDHLRRTFKAATGHTPTRYHQRLRMNAAREMLSVGNLSVAEVGRQLGYDDPAHFCRVFKRITGHSPSQERAYQAVSQNVDGEFYPFVRRL